MKNSKLQRIVTLIAVMVVIASFSSCNRGYGCPSNFSLETVFTSIQQTVCNFIFTLL